MKGTEVTKKDVIEIDQNWSLKRDTYCWVLLYQEKVTDPKTGEEKLKVYDPTYHPSIKVALQTYLDRSLKPAKSIKELVVILSMTYDKIEAVCKNCPDTLKEAAK